jgi:hypothetical protein
VGKFDRGISEARSVRGDRALIVAGTGHNGKYSGGSEPPIKIHRRGCIGADGSIKGDLAIPQSGFRISVSCNSTQIMLSYAHLQSLPLLPSRNRLIRPRIQMPRCVSRIRQNRLKSEDVARAES